MTTKRPKPRQAAKASARKMLAAQVTTTLKAEGIDAVLVGGSVVSIYSAERYVTDDLDFVSHKSLGIIGPVMERAGWKMIGNRAVRTDTELYVQFCAPPVAVGREPVVPVTLRAGAATIETLSPTDCVLDRLMKYYHWDDEEGLEQAVLVAGRQEIDLARVREVSGREGMAERFRVFEARLGGRGG